MTGIKTTYCPMCNIQSTDMADIRQYRADLLQDRPPADDVFTKDWAGCCVIDAVGCDPLHGILKGVFGGHFFLFLEEHLDEKKLLDQYQAVWGVMPHFPGLRRFRNGPYSLKVNQGKEYKEMMRVITSTLQAPFVNKSVARTFQHLIQFWYLVTASTVSDSTLQYAEEKLRKFHRYKYSLAEYSRLDLSFAKLHSLVHYLERCPDH